METDEIVVIHALDNSTQFLEVFKDSFQNYNILCSNDESFTALKQFLGGLDEGKLIVFLAHGNSNGLYKPNESNNYVDYFLNLQWANIYMENQKVIFLSCRSNEFAVKLQIKGEFIGFGNIISSKDEVKIDAENNNNIFRILKQDDIDVFNSMYCNAVIRSLLLFKNDTIMFNKIPQYIEYYINKDINKILRQKDKKNRIEVARLLFEFRNEMIYKSNV